MHATGLYDAKDAPKILFPRILLPFPRFWLPGVALKIPTTLPGFLLSLNPRRRASTPFLGQ
jgi:hypothetical protein